jgi:beta-N-acetylhexosaminidase
MSLGPLMISLRGTSLAADECGWLKSPAVGGVILFARNYASPEQLRTLVDEIQSARSPALLIAVDQEGGRVQRFRAPFTELPAARLLGHLYDADPAAGEQAARSLGWTMAAELRAFGIDISFAPVVDLDLGLAGVIGDRALHSDAGVVARLALAFNAGAHDAGMAITAKHFPTHAGATGDSHTEIAVDGRGYADLYEDLEPYRRLIDGGLQSVMVAHVIFPKLDPLPASLSRWWITNQLRGELKFHGAIISDDMSMVGAAGVGDLTARVERALDAGCDLVLVCNVPDELPALLEALDGYVSPAGQLRLMRLRGRQQLPWDELHASPQWQGATRVLAGLSARPKLELQG